MLSGRRGDIIGKPADWMPGSDLDHFMVCPGCGAIIDMRDLGMAFQHAGELPHGTGVQKS
jgi:hypothetical protein